MNDPCRKIPKPGWYRKKAHNIFLLTRSVPIQDKPRVTETETNEDKQKPRVCLKNRNLKGKWQEGRTTGNRTGVEAPPGVALPPEMGAPPRAAAD